jgi:hypothetical protein
MFVDEPYMKMTGEQLIKLLTNIESELRQMVSEVDKGVESDYLPNIQNIIPTSFTSLNFIN